MQDKRKDGGLNMDHDIEKWVSMDDIKEHLGVSRDAILLWIAKRGMPAHKLGKLWKFKKTEVDTWIRSGGAADKGEGEEVKDNE